MQCQKKEKKTEIYLNRWAIRLKKIILLGELFCLCKLLNVLVKALLKIDFKIVLVNDSWRYGCICDIFPMMIIVCEFEVFPSHKKKNFSYFLIVLQEVGLFLCPFWSNRFKTLLREHLFTLIFHKNYNFFSFSQIFIISSNFC